MTPEKHDVTNRGEPFRPPRTAAKQEWERRKIQDDDAIEELMDLVGLEEIKEQILAILAKVRVCRHQGTALKEERFHSVFQGNPGTGERGPDSRY